MVEGKVWINKCGTYGVASAQWYWGRMAALLLRLTYLIIPNALWHFVYVDDFIFLIKDECLDTSDVVILLFMQCLGTPLAWKKPTKAS